MKESTSKEKVLKKIREALINRTPPPYESVDKHARVFKPGSSEFADVSFAEAFSSVGGIFIYCTDQNELARSLTALLSQKKFEKVFCPDPELQKLLIAKRIAIISNYKELASCEVSITGCEALVSRLGSIVVSSKQMGGRRAYIFPPVHVVIANTSQMVNEIADAFLLIRKENDGHIPSMITFITGPSRTADIEKTLVMGAHGPRELFLFLVEK